jgi:hypothetical protein
MAIPNKRERGKKEQTDLKSAHNTNNKVQVEGAP